MNLDPDLALLLLLPGFLVCVVLMSRAWSRPPSPPARARAPRPGFRCSSCGAFRIAITGALDLPGDMIEDEINLQAIACRACAFVGVAVYTESCRGALDRETWNHTGYRMRQADYDALQAAIGRCPTPAKRDCACATHERLGRQEDGQWVWLGGIPREGGEGFPMEMER